LVALAAIIIGGSASIVGGLQAITGLIGVTGLVAIGLIVARQSSGRAIHHRGGQRRHRCARAAGALVFKPIDQALAALDYWLPRLSAPDQAKLQAIADYTKRSALVEGVGLTGVWPLIEDSEDDAPQPIGALQLTGAPQPQVQYPYAIATASPTLQPIAAWLDEVELKLLPSAAARGG
jgi:hypothetical protein